MSKAGYVVKEGGRYKSWKKRWLVIENDRLSYYKKENKKDKCGEIGLRNASQIHKVDYKKYKNCFQIVTPDRTYHITCESEVELQDWCEAIKKQQQVLLNPTQTTASVVQPTSFTVTTPTQQQTTVDQMKLNNNDVSTQNTNDETKTTDVFGEVEKGPRVSYEDFKLERVIGKGSFGKVLLVRKKDTDKVYAMKVLNKKTIIERNEVEHTKSEKNILMKLSHPFLVGLHYSFQTPEKLYFIMDYVNGGELFYHLQKDRKFSEERVRFYAAEIATGLEYLHNNGVIYRDLKPENLLLTNEGHIIMTDFGLSKEGLNSSDDRTATFCGTPEYLAPEILEGKGYGKAVDWWSFGTLVFEMLTGLPPFYCEDVQQMYSKIMTAELIIPDSVSANAADLVTKLLERDPEKRLQNPEIIKTHPFFSSIDWVRLINKEIPPPFVPDVKDEGDFSNIDPAFTAEDPTLSDEEGPAGNTPGFEGFTYIPGQ